MLAPPLDSSRQDVYKQLIQNLHNCSWKCLLFFHQLIQPLWMLYGKGWAELSKQRGCVNKWQEIKWRWSSEWLCDTSLRWKEARGYGSCRSASFLHDKECHIEKYKRGDDVDDFPHMHFHLRNSTPLFCNSKIHVQSIFFNNKDLLGQLVRRNFATNQKKSQTFNSHNQSLKNVDTVL